MLQDQRSIHGIAWIIWPRPRAGPIAKRGAIDALNMPNSKPMHMMSLTLSQLNKYRVYTWYGSFERYLEDEIRVSRKPAERGMGLGPKGVSRFMVVLEWPGAQ